MPGVEGTVSPWLVQEPGISRIGARQWPPYRVLRRRDERAVHGQRLPVDRRVLDPGAGQADVQRVEDQGSDQDDAGSRIARVVEELVLVADDVTVERVHFPWITGASGMDELAGECIRDRNSERGGGDHGDIHRRHHMVRGRARGLDRLGRNRCGQEEREEERHAGR